MNKQTLVKLADSGDKTVAELVDLLSTKINKDPDVSDQGLHKSHPAQEYTFEQTRELALAAQSHEKAMVCLQRDIDDRKAEVARLSDERKIENEITA